MPNPLTGEWTRLDWIKHFVDHHKHAGDPSPEEMFRYPQAFAKVWEDHMLLHRHFYTGHEHQHTGAMKPGRTK